MKSLIRKYAATGYLICMGRVAKIGSHGCSFNGHQLKRVPFQVSNIRVGSNCVGYYIYLSVTCRGANVVDPSFFPSNKNGPSALVPSINDDRN
jgi:hypothetical protein